MFWGMEYDEQAKRRCVEVVKEKLRLVGVERTGCGGLEGYYNKGMWLVGFFPFLKLFI